MNARHAALGVVSVVLAILGLRLSRHPLETYGDSAAQYIEHLARLRMHERIGQGLSGGPLERLVALDGLYPPGLPLMELAWGALWGHGAESVVWMGLLWWLLLCGAVGVLARRLDPDTPNAWAAGVIATALLPATQGMALRSYYDLPMTVLLWWAVAVLAGSGAWRGLRAGLLLVAAALVKWTALPFGLVMVGAWMVFSDRDTRRQGGAALAVMGLWAVAFIWAGAESFFTMGGATFQPPAGVVLPDAMGLVPGAAGRWLQAVWANLVDTDLSRILFYPSRLVLTVLAPAGAFWLGVGGVAWWKRGAPGANWIGWMVVGQVAFLLLAVPPLDERFLITLAPGLGLVAGLGLARHSKGAIVAVFIMLAVAVDAHLRAPESPISAVPNTVRQASLEGREAAFRPGLSSSIDRRGWSRSADVLVNRHVFREALWASIRACGGGWVQGPEALITSGGDLNWWTYRRHLAQITGEDAQARWAGEPGYGGSAPSLWLEPSPSDFFGGANTVPSDWELRTRVVPSDGGPGVDIYSPPTVQPCD